MALIGAAPKLDVIQVAPVGIDDGEPGQPARRPLEGFKRRARFPGEQELASFGIVDPMVVINQGGEVISLNPAAQRLFGVQVSAVMGAVLETVWPDCPSRAWLWRARPAEPNSWRLKSDGQDRPRFVHVYPVIGPENDEIGRAIVVSEVSDRFACDEVLIEPEPRSTGTTCLGAVVGAGADTASVLTQVAWQLGRAADATSVYICGWDADAELAIVLAEYMGRQASDRERLSDLGTCYVESCRRFIGVLERGESWIEHSDDPEIPANDRQHFEEYGVRSILYVPLMVRGQLVGWAEIWESRRRRTFARRTVSLARHIARIAAVAIDKAQLHEKLQTELAERERAEEALRRLNDELEQRVGRRTGELAKANADLLREVADRRRTEADLLQRNRMLLSLQSAMASTTGSLDLEFLLDTITHEMTHLLDIQNCTIYHWEGRGEVLTALSGGTTGTTSGDGRLCLTDSPLHRRVLQDASVVHLTAQEEDLSPLYAGYLRRTGAKTLVLIPMQFHGRTVGLIELEDRSVARVFGDYEISAAQLLTSQAAAAIENARLYGTAQREIIDRIFAEDRLRVSLAEKEVLLKEIHHRVKNNLQVISSMLSLQASGVCDPTALTAFRESQDRVRSMALIHEKLYRSQDLAEVDLSSYLEDLAAYLVRTYQPADRPVSLMIRADGVRLSVDQAVPCGLIVNELVSNALKHAFPGEPARRGHPGPDTIAIELHPMEHGHLELSVRDNGIGLSSRIDPLRSSSLGLQIVNTLVNQLDGEMEVEVVGGTAVTIAFPLSPRSRHAERRRRSPSDG